MPMTDTDRMRMERLIDYRDKHGHHAALEKAANDAVKILTPEKAAARAELLQRWGHSELAHPFKRQVAFLNAQGIY